MNVLLSIKPKYAEAIINGNKLFEFRKSIFKYEQIERVYIYASAPISRVIGYFKVGRVTKDNPAQLWDDYKEFSGISHAEFSRYFKDHSIGYAIEIKSLKKFEKSIDPKDIIIGFVPPRSFRYVDGQFPSVGHAENLP